MEEQEQQPIRTSPYMSPMHQFGSSIIMLTNPDSELAKMEMTFRNVRIDKDGNTVSCGDPLMNDLGINSVLGTVQSIMNRVTVMSNLNKNEIPMLIDFLADTVAKDLMVNRVKYGINSASARDKIFFTAISSTFITMKRGFEEGDRRFWKGSVQEIRSSVETPKKTNMLATLNPWRSK